MVDIDIIRKYSDAMVSGLFEVVSEIDSARLWNSKVVDSGNLDIFLELWPTFLRRLVNVNSQS